MYSFDNIEYHCILVSLSTFYKNNVFRFASTMFLTVLNIEILLSRGSVLSPNNGGLSITVRCWASEIIALLFAYYDTNTGRKSRYFVLIHCGTMENHLSFEKRSLFRKLRFVRSHVCNISAFLMPL